MKLSSRIDIMTSTMGNLFVIIIAVTIFSIIGLSGMVYAQTPGAYNGQGHQFSQHGNFTGHQRTSGSYAGAFPRNERASRMVARFGEGT